MNFRINHLLIILGWCLVIVQPLRAESEDIAQARLFFEQCDRHEKAFDPRLVACYADEAVIQNTRVYPTGQKKVMRLTGVQYKALLKASLPLAQKRNDTSSYSDLEYTQSGDKVIVKGQRYSNLKKYWSPLEIHIGKDQKGEIKFLTEISESQP